MLTQEQIQALKAPFPDAALSADTSRGFELTGIKAAYVIERLNEVLGPCGIGWRYAHSPFEMFDLKNGSQEIVTEVTFQYRLNGVQDGASGCPPAEWCALTHGWSWRESGLANWSEPIFTSGGKAVVKGGAPHTDARKSAVTDDLTKAASMLGVGYTVFKGLVRVVNGQRPVKRPGNGHHPTFAQNRATPLTITPDNGNGKQPQSTTVHTHPKNDSSQLANDEADATTF